MANNCYYNMKITGYKECIEELLSLMKWEEKYENDGIGRIFDVSVYDEFDFNKVKDNELTSIGIDGDCAWSILSSMIDAGTKRNLISESKRLNLAIEAYSSEPGMCFQEHVLIDRGKQLINDCVDYDEYDLDELSKDIKQKNILLEKYDVTSIDELVKLGEVEDEVFLRIGGYKERFGEFENMNKNVELITNIDFVKEEIKNYTENGYYTKYEEGLLNDHVYEIAKSCDDYCKDWLEKHPDKDEVPLNIELDGMDKVMGEISKQYQKEYLKDVYMVILNIDGNAEYNFITNSAGLKQQFDIDANDKECYTGYLSQSKTYIIEKANNYEQLNKFFNGELNDIEQQDEKSERYNEDWYWKFDVDRCDMNTLKHVKEGTNLFASAVKEVYVNIPLEAKCIDAALKQKQQLNKESSRDKEHYLSQEKLR